MSVIGVLIVLLLAAAPARALEPDAEALRWWSQCIGATEARLAVEFAREPAASAWAMDGSSMRVVRDRSPEPSCAAADGIATIERWRGSVLVAGVTLDDVLHSLKHVLPRQDDVLAGRFLEQSDRIVRVQLRLVRRKIVTVVLDTEHETTFERRTARLAHSRSVMTRATEIDGTGTPSEHVRPPDQQRGYLWRLNAYTRYAETGAGVLIEMETVTLSRSVPALLRPIVGPFIESVGRESMTRTLEGLQRRFER